MTDADALPLEAAPDAIVIVDKSGAIVNVNSLAEKMFGYSRDQMIGQMVELLIPARFQKIHIAHREEYSRHPVTRPMGVGRILAGRKKDGTEFSVEISLSPLKTERGTFVSSIIRDVSDRKKAEAQIQASLREKESLLKEIHHRVKNNLQVVSSLLRLQSGYIKDELSKEMFIESQNRIKSMALVHEKLYQSEDLSRIDFSEYIESLSNLLFRSFGVDSKQIKFKNDGHGVCLTVETAIPCGLMVNELISNCLKHAFPNGKSGEITVRVHQELEPHYFILEVIDNGVGLPENFDMEKVETLGLQLIRTLTQQLNGKLEVIQSRPGTKFRIHFSDLKDAEA